MDLTRFTKFSRYELKYLVPVEQLPALREAFLTRLEPDAYSPTGEYGLWSLYYDTPGLRAYWEKIDGERFRRKVRIRCYGDEHPVGDGDDVWVEIKQRVDRTTQKRRLRLPYGEARRLCRGELPDDVLPASQAFAEEVAGLSSGLSLRPIAMVGYRREAYVGTDYDRGVRVTFDKRVRGRDRDLRFGQSTEANRFAVDPSMAVLEIKVDVQVPRWITGVVATHGLTVSRLSKYCRTVDVFGGEPRSAFHADETDEEPVP